jgi:hypothetical protein
MDGECRFTTIDREEGERGSATELEIEFCNWGFDGKYFTMEIPADFEGNFISMEGLTNFVTRDETKLDWRPDMAAMMTGLWVWSNDGKEVSSFMKLADNGTCFLVDLTKEERLDEMAFCTWGWEWTNADDFNDKNG